MRDQPGAVMRLMTAIVFTFLAAGYLHAEEDCAAPESPVSVSRDVLDELTGWIALHTDYDVSQLYHAPPEISFCGVGDIIDYESSTILVEPFLKAAYDLPNRHIYLVAPWSEKEPFDRSVLLHEMIHDVQLSNQQWECIGAPEMEAYLLQAKYLEGFGIIPNFNWQQIYALSRCPKTD